MDELDTYSRVSSLLNLWHAFVRASKGRRSRPEVAQFEYNYLFAAEALTEIGKLLGGWLKTL